MGLNLVLILTNPDNIVVSTTKKGDFMKKRSLPLAISAISALTLSQNVLALTMEQRMEAMERKMTQMQTKLEHTEAENQQLKKQLKVVANAPLPQSIAQKSADIKNMDDKLAVLENRMEIEKKAAVEEAKKAPKLDVSNKGVSFTSSDGNYKLNLGGYIQADNRYFMDGSPSASSDNFLIRRARLSLGGTLYKNVDFRFATDFAGNQTGGSTGYTTRLFDAFVDLHYFTAASLQAGKFRIPISLERYQTATNLTFIERAYPAQLAPNRDIGIMLHGAIAYPGYKAQYATLPAFKEFFGYEVGVFNGIRDNQPVQNADSDKDNNKEVAARIFSHPFMHSGTALDGLGIGVGGTWGQPRNNTLYGFTSPAQQTIFTYNTATTGSGTQYRIYPQMYWYWKSLGMMGEYYTTMMRLNTVSGTKNYSADQTNSAWDVGLSYVLTGENNSFTAIKPKSNFDPSARTWGAFQAAARYSQMDLDANNFKNFGTSKAPSYLLADPRASVSKAQSWELGLNWLLNENVKIMTNYQQTYFTGGASNNQGGVINRQMEKAFLTRFQLAF